MIFVNYALAIVTNVKTPEEQTQHIMQTLPKELPNLDQIQEALDSEDLDTRKNLLSVLPSQCEEAFENSADL